VRGPETNAPPGGLPGGIEVQQTKHNGPTAGNGGAERNDHGDWGSRPLGTSAGTPPSSGLTRTCRAGRPVDPPTCRRVAGGVRGASPHHAGSTGGGGGAGSTHRSVSGSREQRLQGRRRGPEFRPGLRQFNGGAASGADNSPQNQTPTPYPRTQKSQQPAAGVKHPPRVAGLGGPVGQGARRVPV